MRTDKLIHSNRPAPRTAGSVLLGSLAVLGALSSFAQGTVRFDNNIPGVLVTHVYFVPPGGAPLFGNGPNDTPTGSQNYAGLELLEGSRVSAQLYAGQGKDVPMSSLWPASPVTTFQTGAGAGFVEAFVAALAGVPPDAAVATLQLRVWENAGGVVLTYEDAFGWGVAAGYSPTFNVFNIGGPNNPPPVLTGLQSFSLGSTPEPSGIALMGLGALALWLAARRR